ncbi:MAG: hypothetical protein HRT64_01055 [Erythrobacter sp.]|nr:hypothetical protein [Erythrobacter sp.]
MSLSPLPKVEPSDAGAERAPLAFEPDNPIENAEKVIKTALDKRVYQTRSPVAPIQSGEAPALKADQSQSEVLRANGSTAAPPVLDDQETPANLKGKSNGTEPVRTPLRPSPVTTRSTIAAPLAEEVKVGEIASQVTKEASQLPPQTVTRNPTLAFSQAQPSAKPATSPPKGPFEATPRLTTQVSLTLPSAAIAEPTLLPSLTKILTRSQVNAPSVPSTSASAAWTDPEEAPLEAGPNDPANPVTKSANVSLSGQSSAGQTAQTVGPIMPVAASVAATPAAPLAQVSPSASGHTTPSGPIPGAVEQFVEQVANARDAGRSLRPELTMRHGDFGAVNLRIDASASTNVNDWRATLSARDPAFVPAVQAALAERAVVASEGGLSHSGSFSQRGQEPGSQGSGSQNAGGQSANSGFSANSQGSSADQNQRYGSSTGSEQAPAKPYSGEEAGNGPNGSVADKRDASSTGPLGPEGGTLFA